MWNPSPPKTISRNRHGGDAYTTQYLSCRPSGLRERKSRHKWILEIDNGRCEFFAERKSTPGKAFRSPYNQRSRLRRGPCKENQDFDPFWPDTPDTYRPSRVLLRGNNVETKCQNNVFSLFYPSLSLFTPPSNGNFSPPTHIRTRIDVHRIPGTSSDGVPNPSHFGAVNVRERVYANITGRFTGTTERTSAFSFVFTAR